MTHPANEGQAHTAAANAENAAMRGALEVFAGFGRDALSDGDSPLWVVAEIGDNVLVVEAFREAQRALAGPSRADVLLKAKHAAE